MVAEEVGVDDGGLVLEDDGNDDEVDAPPDNRVIHTKASDPEIDSLYNKWKKGKLVLQSSFQRKYVWDSTKASRLIESAILSIPIPIVHIAEEGQGQEVVIDGQQRLTAFFSFIDGQHPSGTTFSLRGLEAFPELNGKTFAELDEPTQDKVKYYQLRTVTILSGSDPDLKFKIFERLNTGSVPLNDMELRNCVYRGPYMDLLRELAGYADFQKLLDLKEPDKRMRDVELVLRFAAFYHASYLKYERPMKKFFNNDMLKHRDISEAAAHELRTTFRNAVQIAMSLFGTTALKRFNPGTAASPNGKWETRKFNASLSDVVMGVLIRKPKPLVYGRLGSIREALVDLMASNTEFQDAITLGTSNTERVIRRFDLARHAVDAALDGS